MNFRFVIEEETNAFWTESDVTQTYKGLRKDDTFRGLTLRVVLDSAVLRVARTTFVSFI